MEASTHTEPPSAVPPGGACIDRRGPRGLLLLAIMVGDVFDRLTSADDRPEAERRPPS